MSRLKVISGTYGGRFIETLEGRNTRPTSARAKEAVFSAITSHFANEGGMSGTSAHARVLDMFAGSGALGIEALSRGACFACFCEKSARALKVVRSNLQTLGVDKNDYTTLQKNAFSDDTLEAIAKLGEFDLLFLDPPYQVVSDMLFCLVNRLLERGIVTNNTLIYLERSASEDMSGTCSCTSSCTEFLNVEMFDIIYRRNFGEVGCFLLKFKDDFNKTR